MLLRLVFLVSAVLLTPLVTRCEENDNGARCGARFELFEVSSRHLGCCIQSSSVDAASLQYCRRDLTGRWGDSSLELLAQHISDQPQLLTIIYVHGNWLERSEARNRALILSDRIQSICPDQPFRLILYSWPSQREPHPIQDIREHACCAEFQGNFLADLLAKLPATGQLGIIGFSLGGRVVTSGLHRYVTNAPEAGQVRTLRVSFTAPAIDRCWLVPGNKHGRAMEAIDRMVNLYNSCDPVLRRFRFIDTLTRPVAAGFVGFPELGNPRSTEPLAGHSRIEQFDCSDYLGLTHDEKSYFYKCPCFRRAIENLFVP